MRSPARWIAALLLGALALTSAGCSWWFGVARVAPCPGLSIAAVERVLRSDPSIERLTSYGSGEESNLTCWRDGYFANVHLQSVSAEIRVAVDSGTGNRPRPGELQHWTEQADHITRSLSAACPEIGTWTSHDSLERPDFTRVLLGAALALLVVAGGAVTLTVVIIRARERRRAEAAW